MSEKKYRLSQSDFEKIEHEMNVISRSLVSGTTKCEYDDKIKSDLSKLMKSIDNGNKTDNIYDFIVRRIEELNKKGNEKKWLKNNGTINFSKFQEEAEIEKVWESIRNNIPRQHEENTMLRIVFALELDEESTYYFLSLNGMTLNLNTKKDCLVLSLIRGKYYEKEVVSAAFEDYEIKNIYPAAC